MIGLLIGHWASAGGTPAQSVLKVEGLGGLASASAPAAAAATTPGPTVAAPKTSTPAGGESGSEAAAEVAEAKVKAPPPAPKKASSTTLNKLSHLKGKKYQQEINKLTEGDQPIETGGG